MSSDNGFRFAGYHPIISCEETAEQAAVDILLEADALVFPEPGSGWRNSVFPRTSEFSKRKYAANSGYPDHTGLFTQRNRR